MPLLACVNDADRGRAVLSTRHRFSLTDSEPTLPPPLHEALSEGLLCGLWVDQEAAQQAFRGRCVFGHLWEILERDDDLEPTTLPSHSL